MGDIKVDPGDIAVEKLEAVIPNYDTTVREAFTRLHVALDALERGYTDCFEYPLTDGRVVTFRRSREHTR